MLRSLWSCAWLGSRDTGPSRAILFYGPGRLLYSSTRQEMQCCMTQGFPKFWNKILSSLPRNVAKSEGKVERKMKRNQLFWKTRGCIFDRSFDSFLWAHLWPAPWNPWPGVTRPRQSLVWFSFSGRFFNNWTSRISKWPRICVYRMNRSLKGMLW